MSTWMVAEDEPEIYDVLLAMFELWGVAGVAFTIGAEATAWIDEVDSGRVRSERPELALLDIRLQEVSGLDIAKRLRRSPILGNIPIILITAYHMSPDEEKSALAEAQADLLLYKPLPTMSILRARFDEVIEKRKKMAQAAAPVAEAEKAPTPPLRASVRQSAPPPSLTTTTEQSSISGPSQPAPPAQAPNEE